MLCRTCASSWPPWFDPRYDGWHGMCSLTGARSIEAQRCRGGYESGPPQGPRMQPAVPLAKSRKRTRIKAMLKHANPTPTRAVESPSKVERRVMCAGYEGCLDEAIKREWHSFSCRQCVSFEPLRLDPTEWLADSLACIALVYVAEYPCTLKQKPRGGIVFRLQRMRSEGNAFASN
jgi:hypothetical protein